MVWINRIWHMESLRFVAYCLTETLITPKTIIKRQNVILFAIAWQIEVEVVNYMAIFYLFLKSFPTVTNCKSVRLCNEATFISCSFCVLMR